MYKFKSKAAADLVMLAAAGDHVLSLLGREPDKEGIFEAGDLARLAMRLQDAVTVDEAAHALAVREALARGEAPPRPPDGVTLRQRVWPLVAMMRRCEAAGEPIVWGV